MHLRNNLMEVEAGGGEKSQRRELRINIGDFDEMVCHCWRCVVFVGNGLYLLEMVRLCWKCFVSFIQNCCLFRYGFAFVGNGLSLFKMVVFLNTVLPVSIFLYTASAYNNENPPYPVVPLAAA